MPKASRIVVPILGACLLVPVLAAARQDADAGSTSPSKIRRWESCFTTGTVIGEQIGAVKSVWWYPLPKVFALGLSIDYIQAVVPLSVDVSLSAPVPIVVPFVCASAGGALNGASITGYGGGLKLRIWRKAGIIIEYRKYHYTKKSTFTGPVGEEKREADYVGAGIAYIY